MKKSKSNSNRNIIIALIIVIVVIFAVMFTMSQREKAKDNNGAQSFFNDAISVVDRVISSPVRLLEKGFGFVANLFNTYQENQALKKKLDNYLAIESQTEVYKNENENLKTQLEMNATIANYDKATASVISRSPNSWQDFLIIDKGASNGLKVNMPVMGDKGLIGRIIEVNNLTAKVELLTATNQNSNKFPVMITPTEGGDIAYGVLNHYDEKKQAFVISQVTKDTNVKEGDKVTTSGLGGSSPKGLYIGTVKKVEAGSLGLDKEIYVEPAAELYDISVVTVVKRLAESEE